MRAKTRRLEESSLLAQSLVDMMECESCRSGYSSRWLGLQTLKLMVNEADDEENQRIYYENRSGKRYIVVGDIPSLAIKEGTDFSREGMRSKLRGLAARYDGVDVLTTHDLNSAVINVSDVMDQMRSGL